MWGWRIAQAALGIGGLGIGVAPAATAQPPGWQVPGLRELCSDRPGLATPACAVDKGHLQIELGLGDWTLDRQTDTSTRTFETGELLARYGVTDTTELRVAWTAHGHVRERDRASGASDRMAGSGDVTLGLLQNLHDPDGNGRSIALLPQVTLPAGGKAIGAGTWGAALLIPAAYDLSKTFQLTVTPEIDAMPDMSGHGRHLAYGSVFGMVTAVNYRIDLTTEIKAMRDRDPEQRSTQLLASASLDFKPVPMVQLDVQAVAGLNHASPDVQLLFGISEKF